MKKTSMAKWQTDLRGNHYRILPNRKVEYLKPKPQNVDLPVIPLKNDNCLHCKLYKNGCTVHPVDSATGNPTIPERYSCFKIGRNYKEI